MKYIKYQITSEVAYQWVDHCKKELYKLNQLHKPGTTLNKFYQFPGGVYAELIINDVYDTIRLWSDISGFICHFRNNLFPGGISTDTTPISSVYMYPLVDDDKGSFVLTSDVIPTSWQVNRDVENYGNLDWVSNTDILTWRGPFSRYFSMNSLLNISGYTFFDYSELVQGLEINHYTPYTNNIYQMGDVIETLQVGNKVLGCALDVYITNYDYSNTTNPDGSVGGFYDEVWLKNTRIGWQSTSRPTTSWFFNENCTQAINGNRKLDIVDDVGVFSTLSDDGGLRTNSYNNFLTGRWGIDGNGSWNLCRDFRDNTLIEISLNLQMNQNSILNIVSTKYNDVSLPIMISGTQTLGTLTVSGPDEYSSIEDYSYTLTGHVGCGLDTTTWTPPSESCGMGVVRVTLTFLDGSSLTATKDVRMASGVWTLYFSEGTTTGSNVTDITGDTKTIEYFGVRANTSPPHTANVWSYGSNQCVSASNRPQDHGFPAGYTPCELLPEVACVVCDGGESVSTVPSVYDCDGGDPNTCCGNYYNFYFYRVGRFKYIWECP